MHTYGSLMHFQPGFREAYLALAAFLDHRNYSRHCDRYHINSSFGAHGLDLAARLPPEDPSQFDILPTPAVSLTTPADSISADILSSLIAASCIRLVYLERALAPAPDPTFSYIPYSITTQCHSTLSVILSCMPAFKPLTDLVRADRLTLTPKSRHSKHWSGTTIGGTPYESYTSFGKSSTQIIKEPLHSIQRSMSTPTSPAASRNSLHATEDILLPEILMPTRYAKAPPRPPPPKDEERPDLSMFTKTTMLREPPAVTRLGSVREKAWERVGRDRSLKARGLA